MSEEEPKIIVDESWKSQVQREKEEAARKLAAAQQPQAPEAENPAAGGTADADEFEQATFSALVGSLATQSMFALGLVADPNSGQVMVNLDAARYTLDMLALLKDKTQGNLTPDENEVLTQSCDELEQAFEVRLRQFQEQAMQRPGIDPGAIRGE